MNTKNIGKIAILALVTATLITVAVLSNGNDALFAKKPDDNNKKKKDNVKVQVKVKGIPLGTSTISTNLIVAGGNPIIKTQTIEDNETSTSVMFNKVIAAKGDSFTVSVNDRIVDGKITDTKKPNKVIVNLS